MTRELLLINPVQEAKFNLGRVPGLRLSPTGLAYVAALTPPDWSVRIVDENVESSTFEHADLVGITAITSNAPRAYAISERYRQKGVTTVMGGIHASMLPDEALRFVDCVVIGEAESVWESLLRDFANHELKRIYRGEHAPLEALPSPRRDLYFSGKYHFTFVQTARGCPNDCEFCSVSAFNGRTYRQRPIEKVLEELETAAGYVLFFMDDNLLGHGKQAEERAIRLFRGMKEMGLRKRWACQVGINFADNPEVLRWAHKAGCVMAFIGFESVNEETLEGMRKHRNLRVGVRNYRDVVERIHDNGIGVHAAFVFGGDGDRKDVFPRTAEFLLDSRIDSAQLTILTPLPGTRLYDRLRSEGRLLRTNYPDDWRHYDFAEAVFRPRHMTPLELEDGIAQVYLHTTSRLTSLRRAFNSLAETRSLMASTTGYLWNRGYGSLAVKKYVSERNMRPPQDGMRQLAQSRRE